MERNPFTPKINTVYVVDKVIDRIGMGVEHSFRQTCTPARVWDAAVFPGSWIPCVPKEMDWI